LKLVTRVLAAAIEEGVPFDLASVSGGSKHNAIPRDAEAIVVPDPNAKSKLEAVADKALAAFRIELAKIDDGLQIEWTPCPDPRRVLSIADRDRLVQLLLTLPHGVLGMSPDIPGLVETSSNLAVVKEQDGGIRIVTSSRSSVAPSLAAVLAQIRAAAALASRQVTLKDGYPGWKPNLDSKALAVVREVYRSAGRRSPTSRRSTRARVRPARREDPRARHGLLRPADRGRALPDERVNVPSVERFWGALTRCSTACRVEGLRVRETRSRSSGQLTFASTRRGRSSGRPAPGSDAP
jgi:dipeptidase D